MTGNRVGPEMNESQRQQLSALADGELDTAAMSPLLTALERHPEMQATWERYHLIGHLLRSETADPECRDIAARVRARLAAEPAVLAPHRSRPRRPGSFRVPRVPLVGFGLAAGLVLLAILILPRWLAPPRETAGGPTTLAALAPPPGLATAAKRWHLEQPGLERKLDRFLINHQARSPASGIKGFFPYATVVGYEAKP